MTTSAILLACIHILNILAIITLIFFQRKESSTRFAWILVLVFLPVAGFVLYLLFGRNHVRKERFAFSESAVKQIHQYLETQLEQADSLDLERRYEGTVRVQRIGGQANSSVP